MAASGVGRVALMSIHPEFVDGILGGTKRVEFRKRPVADDVTHVLVYATAPVSALVGVFQVTGQDTAAPSALWSKFAGEAGISRARFREYFRGRSQGTGIRIGQVTPAAAPLSLIDVTGLDRPPQSFQYIPEASAVSVVARVTNATRPARG